MPPMDGPAGRGIAEDASATVAAAGEEFIAAFAAVLQHLTTSSAGSTAPHRVTRFHAVRAPALRIQDYLLRISSYFQCSHESLVLSLIYIDRIVRMHPEFQISNLNVHRLLCTSVTVAAKFFDDVYYSNAYYAKVGGVRTQELNALEALFLQLIDWRLHVAPEEYEQYLRHVLQGLANGTPVGATFVAAAPATVAGTFPSSAAAAGGWVQVPTAPTQGAVGGYPGAVAGAGAVAPPADPLTAAPPGSGSVAGAQGVAEAQGVGAWAPCARHGGPAISAAAEAVVATPADGSATIHGSATVSESSVAMEVVAVALAVAP